ncbi:lipase 3-like [Eupeodes corollae]|uniref:lipase 3-like n=1 Tax=Eupeodes corollae TaxID=290404 RepID=UPI002490FE8B|nr:lipase 3-like [Eupeodes corollae]
MILSWILFGVVFSLFTPGPAEELIVNGNGNRKSSVTTGKLVAKYGYPFEEHSVETSDGYILGVHRIPYSPKPKVKVPSKKPRPVVFLMHGLLASSSDWVLLGPETALAFQLSDAGYDVWMGNARGNVYSRKHRSRSPRFQRFWNFDWHEIGIYDIPATIEYICNLTGEDQVTYFGHSQGTTTFLVMSSLDTEIQHRIKSAHLLAPVAFMKHLKSPFLKWTSLMTGLPNFFPELFGSMEFMPSSKLMEMLGYSVCTESSIFSGLCSNPLFLIAGFDTENLNEALLPDIMATGPAGASVNQLYHFMQEKNSGRFREFDYGLARNLAKYNSRKPPNYPLENIDVPIYLYYGKNDYLSAVVDVEKLIKELPKSSLRRAYLVPHPRWNHFDFLWGLNTQEQVYDAIFEDLAEVNRK